MERGTGYDIEHNSEVVLIRQQNVHKLSPSRLQAIAALERSRRARRAIGAITAATLALASTALVYVKEHPPGPTLAIETVDTCGPWCPPPVMRHSPLLAPLESTTSRPATSVRTTVPAHTVAVPAKLEPLPKASTTTSALMTSPSTLQTHSQVVSAAALLAPRFDIAWPQCPDYVNPPAVPPTPPASPESIVEITRGQPDKPVSECFKQEASYQGNAHQFYFMGGSGGQDGYTYGYDTMQAALRNLGPANYPAFIWYDAETSTNAQGQPLWPGPASKNIASIKGSFQAVRDASRATHGEVNLAGIYSNQHFMHLITNSLVWPENLPMWLPTGSADVSHVSQDCAYYQQAKAFTKGTLELVQYQEPFKGNMIDIDRSCP